MVRKSKVIEKAEAPEEFATGVVRLTKKVKLGGEWVKPGVKLRPPSQEVYDRLMETEAAVDVDDESDEEVMEFAPDASSEDSTGGDGLGDE